MPKPANEEVKQQWKTNILQQRESGFSVCKWCRQNNISVHTFRYWKNKIFSKPQLVRSAFQEIPRTRKNVIFEMPKFVIPRKTTEIAIEYLGTYIHVNIGFDITTLKQCLKAIKEMTC